MLILERSVTKYYWMKMYRYFFRKLQRGNYEVLASTRGGKIVRMGCGKDCRAYAVVVKHEDHLRPIAWLYLWRKPGWKAWEVMQVFVFEKVRGQGLARKLYSAAINLDNIIVASGKTQSKSSRALWASFVRQNTFNVFAIDYWNLRSRAQVLWDSEEQGLYCNLEIYTPPTATERDSDVRLIATKHRRSLV